MQYAIRTTALRKTFERRVRKPGVGGLLSYWSRASEPFDALRGLDCEVERGEALALIGPNGAGKSTTIKLLTGILHPSSGDARVLGLSPWRERKRLALNIATVFGQRSQLWYDLPASASFDLLARIYELPQTEYRRRRSELIERFELAPLLETSVRKLSLGQRMRCELAASLLHRPQVLFLDEPTIGLDVLVKQQLRALIRELNRDFGVTVLLTSHDAGDIEQLCQRVIVINHGSVVFDDTVDNLRRRYLQRKVIVLRLTQPAPALPVLTGVALKQADPFRLELEVDTQHQPIERVVSQLLGSLAISDITIEDPPLEEIIAAMYRDQSPALRTSA
jgi:ABC-2 type transport system ATP-binding protein